MIYIYVNNEKELPHRSSQTNFLQPPPRLKTTILASAHRRYSLQISRWVTKQHSNISTSFLENATSPSKGRRTQTSTQCLTPESSPLFIVVPRMLAQGSLGRAINARLGHPSPQPPCNVDPTTHPRFVFPGCSRLQHCIGGEGGMMGMDDPNFVSRPGFKFL